VFDECRDGMLGENLSVLHTAAVEHEAALGPAMVALALSLKETWETVHQSVNDAKGMKGGSATARRASRRDLERALALLRLELGKQYLGDEKRLRTFFPQHLLGFPMSPSRSESKPDEAEEAAQEGS
jgi:hypothetical protein